MQRPAPLIVPRHHPSITATWIVGLCVCAFTPWLFRLRRCDGVVYDEARAVEFAQIAGAAYCEAQSLETWTCGSKCIPGISNVTVCKGDGTQALVGTWKGNAIISFQGSSTAMSYLQDLNFDKVAPSFACGDCHVHAGFLGEWMSLKICIERHLMCTQPNKGRFRASGHSLGAAVSTLAVADLVANGWDLVEAYNFGMPRVGDKQFKTHFENVTGGRVFRVTHRNDPVPLLPPETFGFDHMYPEVFYPGALKNGFRVCSEQERHRCLTWRMWILRKIRSSSPINIFSFLADLLSDLLVDVSDHTKYMDVDTGSQGCNETRSTPPHTCITSQVCSKVPPAMQLSRTDRTAVGTDFGTLNSVGSFAWPMGLGSIALQRAGSIAVTVGSLGLEIGSKGVQLVGEATVGIGSFALRTTGSVALTVGSAGLQAGSTGVQLAGHAAVGIGSVALRTTGSGALMVGSAGLQAGSTGVQLAGHAVVSIGSVALKTAGSVALTAGSVGLEAGSAGVQLAGQAAVGIGSVALKTTGSVALTVGSAGLQAGSTGVQLAGHAAFGLGSATVRATGSLVVGAGHAGLHVATHSAVALGSGTHMAVSAAASVGSAGLHATASVAGSVAGVMDVAASATMEVGAKGVKLGVSFGNVQVDVAPLGLVPFR